jgi:hypothetical protein
MQGPKERQSMAKRSPPIRRANRPNELSSDVDDWEPEAERIAWLREEQNEEEHDQP